MQIMQELVDFHIHTNATPHHASWEPEQLVQAALERGLSWIAVTDHNTVGNVAAVQAAGQRHGLGVLAGVEIDSAWNGKLWHILVYGVAPESCELQQLCAAVFERNAADAQRLQAALTRRGFDLAGLEALGRPANVADVATFLARRNRLAGRRADEDDAAAGMRYVLSELPGAYAPLPVDEVAGLARRLRGFAVLAHPGRSQGVYAIPADEADVAAMVAAGIGGIEVFYPSHSPAQRGFYADLARRYNLLMSGGSDSHHPAQGLASWDLAAMVGMRQNVIGDGW
jgi:3',5'-nucleoside bisphosphate phosphatase